MENRHQKTPFLLGIAQFTPSPSLSTQFWATFCIHIVNIENYANINVFDQTNQLSPSFFFLKYVFHSNDFAMSKKDMVMQNM